MENNLPAFPVVVPEGDWHRPGLTQRELIAAMAMQGIISNWGAQCKICDTDPRYNGDNFADVVAINSVEFADALLKELSKTQP